MSKTRTARARPAKRTPVKRSGAAKVKQAGWLDRAWRLVPFTERQVQRGLTAAMVGVFLLGGYVAAYYSGLVQGAFDQLDAAAKRGGFEVQHLEITGVDQVNELEVYAVAVSAKDRSMLRVDVDKVRADLMKNGWIKDARVTRRLPATLAIEIVEREPIAIWQRQGQLALIDRSGETLEKLDGKDLPKLLVLMGEAANKRVDDLYHLLDAAPALRPQIASAHWVGKRRWDLTFKTGETLVLPEGKSAAAAALVTFARMDGISRLLGGRYARFDLRDPDTYYLRTRDKENIAVDESGLSDAAREQGDKREEGGQG